MLAIRCIVRSRALAWIVLVALASSAYAQTATGPAAPLPAWPDQSSAYNVAPQQVANAAESPLPEPPPIAVAPVERPVVQAAYEAPAPTQAQPASASDPRRLAPPGERRPVLGRDRPRSASALTPDFGLPVDSIYTTLAALAVVVGLFLACAWAVRRGQRKSNSVLPEGVVSVLGRVPLGVRQFAELVRVGNKLVLLSVTPTGVEPLTEVTDPAEIDRLLGLCQQRRSNSTTAEFDQVFRQLADDSAPAGFLGSEASHLDLSSADDPFAAYRGGFSRG